MLCEVCGREVTYARRVLIEGSVLRACEGCQKFGPPPNRATDAMRENVRVVRIVYADIPDGPAETYRITVDEAAEGIDKKERLKEALVLGVERGNLLAAQAMEIADKRCGEERERALLEIAEVAVLDRGAKPVEMAVLLSGYGITEK